MELLLFFFLFIIFRIIVSSAKTTAKVAMNPLILRIKDEKFDEIDTFGVYINGSFKMPTGSSSLVFRLNLYQDYENKKMPVMCMIEKWTGKDKLFFNYVSDVFTPGSGGISFTSEARIVAIPKEVLKFPFKGKSKLIFELSLIGYTPSGVKVFHEISKDKDFISTAIGYQDRMDNVDNFNISVAKISAVISSIDGDYDDSERTIFENWLEENGLDNSFDELMDTYDDNLDYYGSIDEAISKIDVLLSDIKDNCDPADKMNLLNLIHKISIIDGDHNSDEEKLIRFIVKRLDIDESKYNLLITKDVKISARSVEDDFDAILGLSEDLDDVEKKRILKEQFKIWNQKITSSNPIEAKNAKRILEYIAEKRSNI